MKAKDPIRFLLLAALSALLLVSCGPLQRQNKRYDPAAVKFDVAYNTYMDHIIYPSLVLGLARYMGSSDECPPLFTASVVSPTDDAVLRIVVDSSALNYVTILQETLPHRGTTYTFYPRLKWKYDVLRRLRQQGAVDLTFTCFINDEEVDVKTLYLNYRSVNECPLSLHSDKGDNYDSRWLFAAYVNEDHPYIDEILSSLLQQGLVKRFSGYQTGSVTPEDQVFALWYYALGRGITYSSITCTSNPSENANVQHIRFFDEVYNTRQANCVDACVFFASLMRKIGLKPVIFVEPCHAYLGFYTDKNRKNITLLETTITSWVNFPKLDKSLNADGVLPVEQYNNISRYLTEAQQKLYLKGDMSYDELKRIVARALFEKAKTYDCDNYNANKAYFSDTTKITYQQLDIEQLRKVVQPIN